ncbi:MAG: hypothetical protein J0L88_05175 [Xanthomonadales bacterium]|nr:hypothetical protein [Xanthomonadales bacterium]
MPVRDAPPPKPKTKPASGYPHEQPLPGGPKYPGRGRPDEPQNDPARKPGESPAKTDE